MLKLLNRMIDLLHLNDVTSKTGSCRRQSVSTFLTTNYLGVCHEQ